MNNQSQKIALIKNMKYFMRQLIAYNVQGVVQWPILACLPIGMDP
jgi:hypothetical protein